MAKNGLDVEHYIDKMKFKAIDSESLHKAVFSNLMDEKELWNLAADFQNDLMNGTFQEPASDSFNKYGDIEKSTRTSYDKKKKEEYDEVYMVHKYFKTPAGMWRLYTTRMKNGKYDTGIYLYKDLQDSLLADSMVEKEIIK